ncbi:uncharacterized protein EV422DRAFT_498169 [Fimicolochytrium jonesii]|uniref:uncharacterized protein n=1 Tax=Fimicolochytrium jonesii TaxID=1396493 RepID=UPI0022FEBF5A|nr:uncharacterized protein EV422DRAFT_498169 [Fimicolochytrium jonesii]KAI8819257.1 hypothetical protein EV422DRAFT_498169 [Fimicolochytrium jonesii]
MQILGEYMPRHTRACNVVIFCPTDPKLLAVGFEKVRNDAGLVVWDTETSARTGVSTFADKSAAGSAPASQNRPVPVAQFGSSEGISSAGWLYQSSPLLVAGMGLKWIRSYDMRVTQSTASMVIPTKAVLGIVADPFNGNRLASFAEDAIVRVWDIRKASEPALTINSEFRYGISHVAWSPQRAGCLAAAGKESTTLRVWDTQEGGAGGGKDDSFPTFAWIPMSLSDDFSHHLITACLDKDRILSIVRLPPTYRMSFCPLGSLAITAGPCVTVLAPTMSATKGRLQLPNTATLTTADADPIRPTVHVAPLTNNDVKASKSTQPLSRLGIARRNDLPRDDIAVIMRTRAVQGYAFDALANAKLFERCADTDLEDVWTWIHQLAKHIALGRFRIGHVEYAGQGVQTVVQDMLLSTSSRKVVHHDDGTRPSPTGSGSSSVRGPEPIFPLKTYTSPYRDLALLMCGWSFHFPPADRDEREDEAGKLQAGGEHEKAAGWALFHGSSLGLALEVLKSAKDERLKLVATAIAGYSASRSNGAGTSSSSSTWEDLCRSLSSDLKDPYLRAIFALIASNGNWRIVLQERGLSLRDRVGIALRFLSDEELVETINDMTAEMTSAGDVKGLLLTGLVTPTGMTLLETYINHCGDVQTAALLLLHTPGTTTAASASAAASSRVLDLRVDEWSEYYRALLDRWQLYHTRARFDIARHRNRNRQRVGGGAATASEAAAPPPHADLTPQIYVRCTFCNAPLAKAAAGDGGAVTAATAAGGQMASHGMTACPTCRKPLPRCALCLLHLGTPADTLRYFGRRGGKANEPDTDLTAENKDLGFELWFTWCQTCRHGGHALHMLQWFEGHAVCPVSNCACRCREL